MGFWFGPGANAGAITQAGGKKIKKCGKRIIDKKEASRGPFFVIPSPLFVFKISIIAEPRGVSVMEP